MTRSGAIAAVLGWPARECIVCGEALRRHEPPAGEAVCESPHCRLITQRRAQMTPGAFQQLVAIQRRRQRLLRDRIEAGRRQLAARREREARENESVRVAASADPSLPSSSYPLVAIPRGPRALEPMTTAYLDRVTDLTVAGSCINHTDSGCSLPREMRSDTCNDYFCDPLRAWRARCSSGEPPLGALVVQRALDNLNQDRGDAPNEIVGIGIVTPDSTRLLDLPWHESP